MDEIYKKQYPSALATYAPLEYAIKKNINSFDFLGAGSPEKDYGVREFKSRFGGELVEYGRFERIHKPLRMKIAKLGLKLYKYF